MGLRGNGTIPAVYSQRIQLAKHAGMQVMEMVRRDIKPRDIMTYEAFENALTMDMALGCSTNSMLHLPAIAHECGIELNMDIANAISEKVPNVCHLAPAGPTYMEDLNAAGGIYAVMKEIADLGLLHTDLMTVTGHTIAENIKDAVNLNPEVIRRPATPTPRPAALPSSAATSPPTPASSNGRPSPPRCWCTKALPAALTRRRRPRPPSTPASSTTATSSSSATKARRAAPACGRC